MNNKKEIDIKLKNIIEKIHDQVYQSINKNTVDVFLCGGISTKKQKSIRDQVYSKLWGIKDLRILYPEDLFMEMLNINNKYNLLNLENFLADNCDIICIICESAGSLVELGAFVNHDKIQNKVVAVIEKNKTKKQSFIMLGPIKVLKLLDKKKTGGLDNVITYDKLNIESLTGTLITLFKSYNKVKRSTHMKQQINSIIGLYHFIPLLLYFFKELTSTEIADFIKYLQNKNNCKDVKFDITFRAALKLLYKEHYIHSISSSVENKTITIYSLTDKGIKNISNQLEKMNLKMNFEINSLDSKTITCDKIRLEIMNIQYKYYNCPS